MRDIRENPLRVAAGGWGLMLMVWLALSGCSVDPVRLDYDTSARFPAQAKWAFIQASSEAKQPVSLMDTRVHDALKVILGHRGWQEVEPEQARILWRWDVVEDSELDPQPGVGWGVGFGFGHRHSGIGLRFWDPAPVKQIRHYRLVLEAVDAVTGRVIWHAESRERLLRDGTPAERTAQVDRLVATLLQKWPPTPSSD